MNKLSVNLLPPPKNLASVPFDTQETYYGCPLEKNVVLRSHAVYLTCCELTLLSFLHYKPLDWILEWMKKTGSRRQMKRYYSSFCLGSVMNIAVLKPLFV